MINQHDKKKVKKISEATIKAEGLEDSTEIVGNFTYSKADKKTPVLKSSTVSLFKNSLL